MTLPEDHKSKTCEVTSQDVEDFCSYRKLTSKANQPNQEGA